MRRPLDRDILLFINVPSKSIAFIVISSCERIPSLRRVPQKSPLPEGEGATTFCDTLLREKVLLRHPPVGKGVN